MLLNLREDDGLAGAKDINSHTEVELSLFFRLWKLFPGRIHHDDIARHTRFQGLCARLENRCDAILSFKDLNDLAIVTKEEN